MSFYRKYRPQTLTEIVGQTHIRQTFLNALKKGSLVHAYIFTGPRGTGKTSLARIIARALNCESPAAAGEPCNTCRLCTAALDNHLVDLVEIDAASNRGIDEMRDLKEKITFAPSQAKNKIYIIDEVHMLTKEAFNALLKTLEEPPAHAYFILATTEAHKVPETILSRCQRFDFHRIADTDITAHLKQIAKQEKIETDDKALALIAKQSAGGLRDALGLLEQLGTGGTITADSVGAALGLSSPVVVEDFVHALLFGQTQAALAAIDGLVGEGINLIQFNKAVLGKLREVLLERVADNKLAEAKGLLVTINEFTRAGEELKSAIIPQLPLETAAVAVCGSETEPAVEPKAPKPSDRESKVETKKKVEPAEKTEIKPQQELASQTQGDGVISLESAQKALPAVLGQLKDATIKMALKDATLLKVTANKITLGVPSDFILSKLETPEAKSMVADVFSIVLSTNIVIAYERVEIELVSAAPTAAAVAPTVPPKQNITQAAEALFADGDDW